MARVPRVPFSLLIFILLFFSGPVSLAQPAGEIEIIFDASRSMNEAAGGTTKLDAAKQALTTIANQITPGSLVGLRIFGKNPVQGTVQQACLDSELTLPISPFQKERMIAQVLALQAQGQTLIGYSLELAARDFSNPAGGPKTIILVSDGEESCGRDPVAVVESLKSQGFNVVIHTIGFAVDEAARGQLQKLSDATGGIYADAKDAGELTQKLTAIGEKTLLLEPEKKTGDNLLAASTGARVVYSSKPELAKLIDGAEDKTDALYPREEAVFSFRGNQAVLLEKFAVPVFERSDYNPGALELWGSLDSPEGGFFPIETVQVKNQVFFGNVYQEFPIDPPAAVRYLKVVIGPGSGGGHSYQHEWKAYGKYLAEEEIAEYQRQADQRERNLLELASGGQLIAASDMKYQALIDGHLNDPGSYADVGIGSEGIFGFSAGGGPASGGQEGRTAVIKKIAIPIFEAKDFNVKTIEISVSEKSPTSGFTTAGTFETTNMVFAGNPYQEFEFETPIRAKYLRVKVLAAHGANWVRLYELQAIGTLE